MVSALLTYTIHVYPEGCKLVRQLDPFIKSIITGSMPIGPEPGANILGRLDKYRQKEEKELFEFKEDWEALELGRGFFSWCNTRR